jgi:hypothetical protein
MFVHCVNGHCRKSAIFITQCVFWEVLQPFSKHTTFALMIARALSFQNVTVPRVTSYSHAEAKIGVKQPISHMLTAFIPLQQVLSNVILYRP